MPEKNKISWAQLTVNKLCAIQANTGSISGDLKQLSAEEGHLEGQLTRFNQSLADLGGTLKASRDIIRALALPRNDADVILSNGYLQRQLNLEELLGAIKYDVGGISVKAKPPFRLLSVKSDDAPFDNFGPDQFGISANTEIKTKFKTYNPTLHFAFGLSVHEHEITMYVAHQARLRETSGLEPILPQLEKTLNKKLRVEIAKQKFPAPKLDQLPLPGREVKYIAHEVSGHTTLTSSVAALPGSKPIPRHDPLPKVVSLPNNVHEIRRIHPAFLLESFVEQVKNLNLPALFPPVPPGVELNIRPQELRLQEPVGTIVINPLNPGSLKHIFLVATQLYCINEFQDREDYGEVKIGARPSVRRANDLPDTVEVYFDTFFVKQPSLPLRGVRLENDKLPKPTFMRLTKAIQHDVLLTEALMSVTIRYRLD